MQKTQAALIVFLFLGGMFAMIGVFIAWAVRQQKRRRAETFDRLKNSLEAAGGKTHSITMAHSALQGRRNLSAFEATTNDGLTYRVFTFQRGKYEFAEIQLVTQLNLPLVVCRRETGRDRFGRTIGLNREVQLDDEEFDREVYIESDESDESVRALLADGRLRRTIIDAVKAGRTVTFSQHGVSMVIMLSFAVPAQSQIDERLTFLKELSASLHNVDSAVGKWQGARGDRLLIFGILTFAFFYVLVGAMTGIDNAGWEPIDTVGQRTPKQVALGVGIASLIALYIYVRGHSRSLRNFAVLMLPAAFVLPFTAMLVSWSANAMLDKDPVSIVHGTITSKSETRNGKTMTRRIKLAIDDDQTPPQYVSYKTISRKVTYAQYRLFTVGDKVEMPVHKGAFGWPWAGDLEKKSAAPAAQP